MRSTPSPRRRVVVAFLTGVAVLALSACDDGLSKSEQATAVKSMLVDIPQPPGFEPATIPHDALKERYYLAFRTVSLVTCGWIDHWMEAIRTGDNAAETAAVNAMRNAPNWKINVEMSSKGGYPAVIRQFAEHMAKGTRDLGELEASYRDGLDCGSEPVAAD